jgi:hypothetical protein
MTRLIGSKPVGRSEFLSADRESKSDFYVRAPGFVEDILAGQTNTPDQTPFGSCFLSRLKIQKIIPIDLARQRDELATVDAGTSSRHRSRDLMEQLAPRHHC